ncbi:MAG: hypothetical protein EXQ97_08350 [Alphaproteobacteria bacterium]|nr:hypothetical protein [Alphaproteobacteria bacterium]
MPIELTLLVWTALLAVVQAVIAVNGAMLQVVLPTLSGNREVMPEITVWAVRAARAHSNLMEILMLFSALVLAAHATDQINAMTALGAQLFFWSRVAYAAVYLAGIPWLRTGVWAVSVVGLALIFLQLV